MYWLQAFICDCARSHFRQHLNRRAPLDFLLAQLAMPRRRYLLSGHEASAASAFCDRARASNTEDTQWHILASFAYGAHIVWAEAEHG